MQKGSEDRIPYAGQAIPQCRRAANAREGVLGCFDVTE